MNFKENVRAVGTGMLIGLGTTSLWLAGKAYNKDKSLSGLLGLAGAVMIGCAVTMENDRREIINLKEVVNER
nr:MAG TPA: hypothetical protein [Caudoviricetes sp.]